MSGNFILLLKLTFHVRDALGGEEDGEVGYTVWKSTVQYFDLIEGQSGIIVVNTFCLTGQVL